MPHHHRSGGLRQTNKKNKRSKSSKRSLDRGSGGRVNAKANASRMNVARSKADRRNMMEQRRKASKQSLLQKKRGINGKLAPRVVGIISLGASQDVEERLLEWLLEGADRVLRQENSATARYNTHKKDGTITYLTNITAFSPHYEQDNDDGAMLGALDLCRVCDVVLFVIDGNAPVPEDFVGMMIGDDSRSVGTNKTGSTGQDWDYLISERGDRIISAIKAQGLPTPLTILAKTEDDDNEQEDHMTIKSVKSIRRLALKRHTDLKRYVGRFATTEFGSHNEKVVEADLTTTDKTESSWSTSSAALVRTLCTMAASPPKWVAEVPRPYLLADSHSFDAKTQELTLTGHIRGSVPFDINSLIHIPNMGTFACRAIQKTNHELLQQARSDQMEEEDAVFVSDPNSREPLDMFASPNALEGEQNLVGFDEDDEPAVARPAGWSDYQASWLDAVDDDLGELDHGELARELNQKPSVVMMDDDELSERRSKQKEELEFPDEVQVKEDENARDRFARYRSLKSFRKSFWDPKENLPETYASIYHFKSFRATQRDIMAAAGLDGCVPSGSHVTLVVEGVSSLPAGMLVAVGLLPHENKVSMLHMGVSQLSNCDASSSNDVPIKSKDILTFRCGWRTWKARPIFSQNNLNCDKHKFERFLPQGGAFFAASCFGPVTFGPCPVIVFREGDQKEMVAIGSMLPANADRIVVKRIVLTGYPVRVQKRFATVKYMFHNPDDVRWFKPAGLMTKHGLNGNIVESVGEHGTMKCLFNAPIKQHDTVCLPLYKRIFPKYANTVPSAGDDGITTRSGIEKEALRVL